MKCPRCWAEKVHVRPIKPWKSTLLACVLLRPLKCHHCYHKFVGFWFLLPRKKSRPPVLRVLTSSRTSGSDSATTHLAAMRTGRRRGERPGGHRRSTRADAA
ncbi:MAG: hypothetical protein JXB62_23210 [Pirellulales bacterium]|nr:hypothetical protein [Pirellulales bacterium]